MFGLDRRERRAIAFKLRRFDGDLIADRRVARTFLGLCELRWSTRGEVGLAGEVISWPGERLRAGGGLSSLSLVPEQFDDVGAPVASSDHLVSPAGETAQDSVRAVACALERHEVVVAELVEESGDLRLSRRDALAARGHVDGLAGISAAAWRSRSCSKASTAFGFTAARTVRKGNTGDQG